MIEKAGSKDNPAFAIHCHVAAIPDSRYNKDSKVKTYWDLCGDGFGPSGIFRKQIGTGLFGGGNFGIRHRCKFTFAGSLISFQNLENSSLAPIFQFSYNRTVAVARGICP